MGSTSYKPVHIAVEPVMGPMATCVSDLKLFCQATFGHSAPDVFPLKYRNIFSKPPIKFAYTKTYPFMDVSPLCHRAVTETIEKLKAAGHPIIEYKFPASFEKLVIAFYQLMSADGWEFYFDKLKGETRENNLRKLLNYAALPNWIKHCFSYFAGFALKDSRALGIINSISKKDVYEIHKLQLEIDMIYKEFRESIDKLGIDVLIMPVHVLPATPNGSFGDVHFCAAHTFMWNLLNQPIGVLPVSIYDETKDVIQENWPRKFKFTDIFSNDLLDKASQNWYNPQKIANLPSGIQIIGKSNEDEIVLEAMLIIEKTLEI